MSRGDVPGDGDLLADRVRALVLGVVNHETDAATTDELADAAEALASMMEAARMEADLPTGGPGHGAERVARLHPVTGAANAFAAPLVDSTPGATPGGSDPGRGVTASGTYTVTHEGPPGCVHGGAIAAGFEHVVERAEFLAGLGPAPRTVTIHYRRPTLLGVPLRFEADPPRSGPGDGGDDGGDDAVPGAVTVSARLVQDGEVTCEARAVRPPEAGPHQGRPENGSG